MINVKVSLLGVPKSFVIIGAISTIFYLLSKSVLKIGIILFFKQPGFWGSELFNSCLVV